MDRRLIGFCVALVCVFGFGYFSGSSSNEGPQKTGTSAELRAISATADDLAVQLPEFKELSKKLAKIEASLPEFATKKDVELAVAQARDAITDEIETTAKLYSAHEVSYQDDSKLAQMELAITDLRNRVADLEKSCSEASKLSASQSVKSGGSNGSLSYSVAAPVVTYGEVVVSNSNGSWGSSVAAPQASRTVRVVEPWQPRTVTRVSVPDQTQVSAMQVSSGQCYIDENGNQVCPQSASSGQVQSVRRGLLGFRRR